MTPLQLRISMGEEDGNLLRHIKALEEMERLGGISPGERRTLAACWSRLDQLTDPNREALHGPRLALANLLMLEITGSML